jgi:hypothetical protein
MHCKYAITYYKYSARESFLAVSLIFDSELIQFHIKEIISQTKLL